MTILHYHLLSPLFAIAAINPPIEVVIIQEDKHQESSAGETAISLYDYSKSETNVYAQCAGAFNRPFAPSELVMAKIKNAKRESCKPNENSLRNQLLSDNSHRRTREEVEQYIQSVFDRQFLN